MKAIGVTSAPNDTLVTNFDDVMTNVQNNIGAAYVQNCTENRVDNILEQSFKCKGKDDFIDFSNYKKEGILEFNFIFPCIITDWHCQLPNGIYRQVLK